MKITLSFNGKKVQNEVTEEKGNEIFKKVASEILDLVKIEPQLRFENWKNYNDSLVATSNKQFERDTKPVDPFEKMKQKTVCKDDEPEHKSIGKRLVIFKCHCGEVISKVVFIDTLENVDVICPVCGEKHHIDKIYQTKYCCYNCGKTASFFTDGNIDSVTCIDCKTPLDLKFNEKKQYFYSL